MAENQQQGPESNSSAEQTDEQNFLVNGIYKLVLAGIGVASVAQEEVEELINKLIERGQMAEKDGRKLINALNKKRKKETDKAEKKLDTRLDNLLIKLNIPQKSEVEALNAKIAALSQKLDELNLDEFLID